MTYEEMVAFAEHALEALIRASDLKKRQQEEEERRLREAEEACERWQQRMRNGMLEFNMPII